jgi:hypothetical protein
MQFDVFRQVKKIYIVGLFDPTIIRNVLPLSVHAVQVDPNLVHLVVVVLVNDTLGPVVEPLRRFMVPPLIDVAHVVELPSLVVKAVGDFVPDDNANATVVQALGKELVVERRLEDSSRKH